VDVARAEAGEFALAVGVFEADVDIDTAERGDVGEHGR
jgi:hypothetical protein